jgi:hypothetical protein
MMRKLAATLTAAVTLAGVGLAAHTASSPGDASAQTSGVFVHLLPYVEQENVYRDHN